MASSSLAWQWVIEALADLKQVQTSILKALITRIPNFLNEVPESVRERVALRYLEECAGDERDNSAAATVSGSETDLGLSAEDVLCNHRRNMASSADPNKDGHEAAYTHGLRQYIIQKKSTIPKCSVELLKESLLDGAHEDTTSMNDSIGRGRSNSKYNSQLNNSEENQRVKRLKVSIQHGTENLEGEKQLQSSEPRKDFQGISDSGKRILQNNVVDTCAMNNYLLAKNSNSQPSADADGDVQHLSSNGKRETTSSPPIWDVHSEDETNIARDECEASVVRERQTTGDAINNASPNFHPINKMLAAEMQRLLSSRISANLDSITGEFTERGLCIKCDKGGELFCCKSSGCLVAVHHNCLGSELTFDFDEMGSFYCPFCSFARSYNAYRKAKKMFSRARKALSIFIGKDFRLPGRVLEAREGEYILRKRQDCNLNPNQDAENIRRADEQPKQTEAEGLQDEDILSSKSDGHATRRQIHKQIVRDKTLNSDEEPKIDSGSCLHGISEANHFSLSDRSVCDDECVGLPEHEMRREPHAGSGNENLPCNMENESTVKAKVAGVVDDRETMHIENQVQDSLEHESNSQSGHDSPTSKATEAHTKKQKVAAVVKSRHTPGTPPQYSKSAKHRKIYRPTRYSNPVVPMGRRTKLLWTAEEEEALKIAVEKSAENSDGSYPWTKILEFGRHVFHKTRQPGDLKDKWRNIRIKEGLQQK